MNRMRTLTTLSSLLVAACSSTEANQPSTRETDKPSGTETDNPVIEPPEYRSPDRFEPDPPPIPGCPPSDDDGPPRELPLWGRSGNYLIGIDVVGGRVPRRGLVVLDVSDPADPRVVSEQPLAGYPRQLLVEGDSATLVIDEFPMFDATEVPAPAAFAAQTKLVRFDLSTPSAPRRLADAALDGEYWQLMARTDGYWVMSGRIDPATQRCDVPQNRCGYVTRDAMTFTHHTWSGTAWVTAERLELPAGPRAWMTDAGFATAQDKYVDPELNFAAFAADGSLGPPHRLPLPDYTLRGSPMYFDSEHVGLFGYGPNDDDSVSFAMYSLDGAELARVGDLGDGRGLGATRFIPGGVLLASLCNRQTTYCPELASEPAVYIDLTDPSALRSVSVPQADAFLPLAAPGTAPTRALGWQPDASGNATTFSLWSLGPAGPTLLDSLPTTVAAPAPSDLELTDDRVIFSLRDVDYSQLLRTLRWDDDVLSLAGPIAGGYGPQHLSVGDWVYEPYFVGLAFGNPSSGSAERQAWDEGEALDVCAVPGGEARLALDRERGVQLFVTRGGATQSLRLSPGARRLLPAGDRLIVLSTEAAIQCSQTGLDCAGYFPNLAIVELEPLRVVQELPLPELPVPALSELSQVEQSWANGPDFTQAPVRLSEQRWLLENEYSATCLTESDCAALGIQPVPIAEANVAPAGQVSCGPGATSCPQPPAPTVYGEARRRVLYVLDAAAAALSDALVVEGNRGTPYQLWTRPVLSQDTLLDLHLEPRLSSASRLPPPTSHEFMLERYVLNATGGLEALPLINVPGYPVALIGNGELLTLEPGPALEGSALLHRLRLSGNGATLVASRALEARVGTVKVVGQTAVYLRDAADACEPVSHVETFALDADLTPLSSLELPGGGWTVVGSSSVPGGSGDTSIVLQQGRGFARLEIDADGNVNLSSFQTAPGLVYVVQVDGGVVRAISGNQVVRLSL